MYGSGGHCSIVQDIKKPGIPIKMSIGRHLNNLWFIHAMECSAALKRMRTTC